MIMLATILLSADVAPEGTEGLIDLRIKQNYSIEQKIAILEQRTDFLLNELSLHAESLLNIRDAFVALAEEQEKKQGETK